MENPLALVLKESHENEDALFRNTCLYFQGLFQSRPHADVRAIDLLSLDWPEGLSRDPRMMGAAFDGIILAMLDHETHTGNPTDLFPVPPELQATFDEIIISQGAVTGDVLLTSPLALSRVCEWGRKDYSKYKRWLKALDKAARIHQQKTSAPLNNPFLPDAKRVAVEEFRLVMTCIKERLSRKRRTPSEQELITALDEETRNNPDTPFLSKPHNREQLLRFFRRDPVTNLHLSPERLFDAYAAFISTHDPEYVRKKISSLK